MSIWGKRRARPSCSAFTLDSSSLLKDSRPQPPSLPLEEHNPLPLSPAVQCTTLPSSMECEGLSRLGSRKTLVEPAGEGSLGLIPAGYGLCIASLQLHGSDTRLILSGQGLLLGMLGGLSSNPATSSPLALSSATLTPQACYPSCHSLLCYHP